MLEYQRLMAEINLDAIAHNVRVIKSRLEEKTKVLAIVKADGYGHGALEVSKVALYNGADWLGIATCDEGIDLRENNIHVPILILGYTVENQMEKVIKYDLTQTVFSYEVAEALSKAAVKMNKTALVHIKVDTGMGRIGFLPTDKNIDEIEKIFNLPNLNVTGVFTHFATADEEDKTFTMEQYSGFKYVTDRLKQLGHKDIICHCANSGAILDMPELQMDMVRAGIILYGMYPSEEVKRTIELKPAMSLKTHISYVKEVEPNTSIGYGRKYYTDKVTKVATVPIGYADGYARCLSNKARVMVKGEYANEIGNICMDQMMIDVTHIDNITMGDEVVVLGCQGDKCVSAEELAKLESTINYEVVCNVGKRVPRVYIKNGEVIKSILL